MGYHTTAVVLSVVGLAGASAFADPAELSVLAPAGPTATGPSALSYIGSLVGPSHVAEGRTPAAARSAPDRDSMLLLMLAGPHNSPTGPLLTIDVGGLGDGPAPDPVVPTLTTADVVGTLQPSDHVHVLGQHIEHRTESAPGAGFQVAVPLPGAGALAGAGLVFVAFRRRRR